MNNFLIKNLYAKTIGLEDCKGYFSKYFKARNVYNNIDRKKLNAKHILLLPGKHVQIDNIIEGEIGNETWLYIKEPSKNRRGTLKVRLKYSQRPVTFGEALNDIVTIYKNTSIDFTSNIEIIPYTQIFKGKWDVGLNSFSPWNEGQMDLMMDLNNSEVTTVRVQFIGILEDNEIKALSKIVDELYLPEYSGYKLKENYERKKYIQSEFTTRLKFGEIKSNMPTIRIEKRFIGFNEENILEFYNKVKSFEKTTCLRPMDTIGGFSDPLIEIEVVSKTNGINCYATHYKMEHRGWEYTLMAMRNAEKDLVKEKKIYRTAY